MAEVKIHREFLKADAWEELQGIQSDQRKRVPPPPLEKPAPEDAERIDLVAPDAWEVAPVTVAEAIQRRQSHRRFSEAPLSLEELSFLLWATQGVQDVFKNGIALRRTVPSAGARHPFETYVLVHRVADLAPGLYRYLAMEHQLCFCYAEEGLVDQAVEACHQQRWIKTAAVTLVWTAIPYRTEWRYSVVSPKLIALDAGHVCENLYLACEAVGAGTCAIGAYHQQKLDALLRVDGEDEFAIYVAPVGKPA
jgi:SagB-type dehydrogenase family enzyme